MSQVSTSTPITSTPPVTVVSSGMSSLPLVTTAPSSMGLPTMLGQHDVVLLPPLTPRSFGGHASVPQQQPPSSVPLQACANYAVGFPQIVFFFRVEPLTILYIICLVSVLVSASMLDAISTFGGSPIGVCTIATSWSLPVAGICATW